MSELEEKLGSILSNPEMMQQIMSLAQTMGQAEASAAPQEPQAESPAWAPNLDLGTLQTLSQFARSSKVDSHQQALLQALHVLRRHIALQKQKLDRMGQLHHHIGRLQKLVEIMRIPMLPE